MNGDTSSVLRHLFRRSLEISCHVYLCCIHLLEYFVFYIYMVFCVLFTWYFYLHGTFIYNVVFCVLFTWYFYLNMVLCVYLWVLGHVVSTLSYEAYGLHTGIRERCITGKL